METHSNESGSDPETTAIRTDDIDVSSLGTVCLKVPKLILPSQYFTCETPAREPNEPSKRYLQRVHSIYEKDLTAYFRTLTMRVKSTFQGSVLYCVLNGKILPGEAFRYDNCTVGEALQFIANLDALAIVDDLTRFTPKVVEINISKVKISGGARHVKKQTRSKKGEITQFDLDTKLILDCQNSIEKFVTNANKLIAQHKKDDSVVELLQSDLLRIRGRKVLSEMEKLTFEKKKISTWSERDAASQQLQESIETLQTMIALLADAELPNESILIPLLQSQSQSMTALITKISRTLTKLNSVPVITILSFNPLVPKRDKRYASYLDRIVPSEEVPYMSDDIVTAIESVIPSENRTAYCLANRLPVIQ